jgi:hypothetical protein
VGDTVRAEQRQVSHHTFISTSSAQQSVACAPAAKASSNTAIAILEAIAENTGNIRCCDVSRKSVDITTQFSLYGTGSKPVMQQAMADRSSHSQQVQSLMAVQRLSEHN